MKDVKIIGKGTKERIFVKEDKGWVSLDEQIKNGSQCSSYLREFSDELEDIAKKLSSGQVTLEEKKKLERMIIIIQKIIANITLEASA